MDKSGLNRKQEFVEGLIVFGVMTGILLPVRLIFFTYVSTNWFGSFGLISIITIVMVLLVKKKKLGKFGKIFERQMNKIQHGKRAFIVYGQTIFFLVILGGNIVAIELGNSIYLDLKEQILEQVEGIDNPERVFSVSNEMDLSDWVSGFVGFVYAVFFAFPTMSALLAIMNGSLEGWPLHFYTVGFVESFEVLGMLIYYRISLKKKE